MSGALQLEGPHMTRDVWMFLGTVLAIVLGPILAVQAQKWREDLRSKSERRREIFEVLMATRLARLSPEHVHALNRIDIEFRKIKPVEEAWRDYLAHLTSVRL
jgi:hypothetical protein